MMASVGTQRASTTHCVGKSVSVQVVQQVWHDTQHAHGGKDAEGQVPQRQRPLQVEGWPPLHQVLATKHQHGVGRHDAKDERVVQRRKHDKVPGIKVQLSVRVKGRQRWDHLRQGGRVAVSLAGSISAAAVSAAPLAAACTACCGSCTRTHPSIQLRTAPCQVCPIAPSGASS